MVLNNVIPVGNDSPVNVEINGNKISGVHNHIKTGNGQIQINFDNAFISPGFINSHDHLDFNLFPQLGNRHYNNYTEWGNYIHQQYKADINKVLKVPLLLREEWGIIKNMVCGVTMVVNHGAKATIKNPLINVFENQHCLHSVGFEKQWRIKINNPFKTKLPVVIHVGEGTDAQAHNEINKLISWNHLHKNLIGIHAVAMTGKQALKFKAVVWCPESNYYLLGKTAPMKQLKEHTEILFGTDSTLTGSWDVWEHIALARKTAMLTDTELYNSLTKTASSIWLTGNNEIKPDNDADFFITKKTSGKNDHETFLSTGAKDILLVVHQGNIRLFDASLYDQLDWINPALYSRVNINGVYKYIEGNIPALMARIKRYYPEVVFPFSLN